MIVVYFNCLHEFISPWRDSDCFFSASMMMLMVYGHTFLSPLVLPARRLLVVIASASVYEDGEDDDEGSLTIIRK